MPEAIRPIPRAVPIDGAAAFDEPSAEPLEPFFWTKPSEPDPGRTTAFALLYADLAGISGGKAAMETGDTPTEKTAAGNNVPISRSA